MEAVLETDHNGDQTEYLVQFRGDAKEYYGIWIINVLLTIATLGVYGAWAKVRDKKYFYGNTYIDGQNFSYHARGVQILIGRVIVLIIISLLSVSQYVSLTLYYVLFLGFFIVLPFLVCRALRFNSRVSSYRNIRFNFDGNYGQAFWNFVLLPILTVLTVYFLTPLKSQERHGFVIGGYIYGNRRFNHKAQSGPYFKAYFIALAIGIAMFALVILILSIMAAGGLIFNFRVSTSNVQLGFFAILMIWYIIILPASLFYKARLRNLAFNNMDLDNCHEFCSEVKARVYIGIVLSNAVLILLSLGFMTPWARVRIARYLASCTTLISQEALDVYSGDVGDEVGVISSEYVDIDGINIGVGL